MVFEPLTHTLFIFAGQRDEKFLSDMYAYDIKSQTATELYSNFTTSGGPDACFTQRAVIDAHLQEIYVYAKYHLIFTSYLPSALSKLLRPDEETARWLADSSPNQAT